MTASPLILRHIKTTGILRRTLGRLTFHPAPVEQRRDSFLALRAGDPFPDQETLRGHAAILIESELNPNPALFNNIPLVQGFKTLAGYTQHTLLLIDPKANSVQVVYRPDSDHNALFLTNQCNSRCIMCSQPPTTEDDGWLFYENERIVELIHSSPRMLGITGGEPTLLGDHLLKLINNLKKRFPSTYLHILTNGRVFFDYNFAERFAAICHPFLTLEIPLYSNTANRHDRIVGAAGAFDQTIIGLYNLARLGQNVRLRVVLQRETIPTLTQLIDFIYRNLPFVSDVALMGLEPMGYVKKNWDTVWIDPVDYQDSLVEAVRYARLRGMPISIYNLPLCIIPSHLWTFARQSISDHKNIFIDLCEFCYGRRYCPGLFASDRTRHSRGIRPLEPGIIQHLIQGSGSKSSDAN